MGSGVSDSEGESDAWRVGHDGEFQRLAEQLFSQRSCPRYHHVAWFSANSNRLTVSAAYRVFAHCRRGLSILLTRLNYHSCSTHYVT